MLLCKILIIKEKNYAFKLGKPNGFICNACVVLAIRIKSPFLCGAGAPHAQG